MFRFPSKTNALRFMREIGIDFGTIIDVGTHAQTYELRTIFPDRRHVLFEPAEEFLPQIEANYAGMDWDLAQVAVSSSDGMGELRKIAIVAQPEDGAEPTPGSGEISHAFLDWSSDPATLSDVRTVRLDTFFKDRADPLPYLLKVDVDGHEIPILQGADGIWDRIDAIIVEATTDTLAERLQFVQSRGFRIFDIVDQCYYCGTFSQVDLILMSERLIAASPKLRPLETETFSWNKWLPVPDYEPLVNAGLQSRTDAAE